MFETCLWKFADKVMSIRHYSSLFNVFLAYTILSITDIFSNCSSKQDRLLTDDTNEMPQPTQVPLTNISIIYQYLKHNKYKNESKVRQVQFYKISDSVCFIIYSLFDGLTLDNT